MKPTPIHIICVLVLSAFVYFNCHGSNQNQKSDSNSSEEEGVTVTAEVKEEDSVEFVQAGESVQIGGTNLTQNSRKVTVYEVEFLPSGINEKILWEEDFEGSTFEIKKLPMGRFLRLNIDGQKAALIQPIISEFGAIHSKVRLIFDGEMTIAAKIFDLIVAKAAAGDVSARQIVEEKAISIIDLVSVAGALREAKRSHDEKIESSDVDLGLVALELISSTKALVDSLPEISKEDFAQLISTASQQTLFSTVASGKSNSTVVAQIGVLIVDKKLQDKSNMKYEGNQNPGFKSVKKLSSISIEVLAAYIAAQEVAAKEISTYTTSGQISETSNSSVTTQTKANTQIYSSDPSLIESLQPIAISAEEYENFNTAAIATNAPTPTETTYPTTSPTSPTPTTSAEPTVSPTPTPTVSPTPTDSSTPTDSPTSSESQTMEPIPEPTP